MKVNRMAGRVANTWLRREAYDAIDKVISNLPGVEDSDMAQDVRDRLDDIVMTAAGEAVALALKALPTKGKVVFHDWTEEWNGTEDPDDPNIYYSEKYGFAQKATASVGAATDLQKRLVNPRAWGGLLADPSALLNTREAKTYITAAVADTEIAAPQGWRDGPLMGDKFVMEMTGTTEYDIRHHAETTGADSEPGQGEFPPSRAKFDNDFKGVTGTAEYKGGRVIVHATASFAIKLRDVSFPWEWDYDRA